MEKEILLDSYPQKSFTDKFDEKQTAFINLGYSAQEFRGSRDIYKQIFQYDLIVGELKKILTESNKGKFDDQLSERVLKHFKRIEQLDRLLDQLTANEQRDSNAVFTKFNQLLSGIGLRGYIMYRINNQDVNSEETLLDKYTSDAQEILKEIKTPEKPPNLEINIEELKKKARLAEGIVSILLTNKEKYEKAQQSAENWIKAEGNAIASLVKDRAAIFKDKADKEHTGKKVWLWLICAGILAIAAIGASLIFVFKLDGNGQNITIGAAVLRVSVVGAFFYLAFLCYQQFNIQRHLYEAYKFKAIALSTMENLVKTFTERQDREAVINKAIEIIFAEPSFKEEKIAHQRMIDDLLDILKRKI